MTKTVRIILPLFLLLILGGAGCSFFGADDSSSVQLGQTATETIRLRDAVVELTYPFAVVVENQDNFLTTARVTAQGATADENMMQIRIVERDPEEEAVEFQALANSPFSEGLEVSDTQIFETVSGDQLKYYTNNDAENRNVVAWKKLVSGSYLVFTFTEQDLDAFGYTPYALDILHSLSLNEQS